MTHLGIGGFGFQRGELAFGIHAHDNGVAPLQVGYFVNQSIGHTLFYTFSVKVAES